MKELKIEGGAAREFLIVMEPTLAYSPNKGKDSLYTKLGGEQAIEKILALFYNKILKDPVLKELFKNVDVNKLRMS